MNLVYTSAIEFGLQDRKAGKKRSFELKLGSAIGEIKLA
jgi:hypothetical protein